MMFPSPHDRPTCPQFFSRLFKGAAAIIKDEGPSRWDCGGWLDFVQVRRFLGAVASKYLDPVSCLISVFHKSEAKEAVGG